MELDLLGELKVGIGNLCDQLSSDRAERVAIGQSAWWSPGKIAQVNVLPSAPSGLNPNIGMAWAIASMRCNNLGAATDYVQVFRGKEIVDATAPRPAIWTFTPGANAPFATTPYHPGRTGFILTATEGLVFNGVVTGLSASQPLVIEVDVIMIAIEKLGMFLL